MKIKKQNSGFVQIPLMIALLFMAVAIPVATKLVKQNQDTRNRAAYEEGLSVNNGTVSNNGYGYVSTTAGGVYNGAPVTSSNSALNNSGGGGNTTTTTKPDGSVTKTTTDGNVTVTTTTNPDGSVTTVTTAPLDTSIAPGTNETVTNPDGSVSTITSVDNGDGTATSTISTSPPSGAGRGGSVVKKLTLTPILTTCKSLNGICKLIPNGSSLTCSAGYENAGQKTDCRYAGQSGREICCTQIKKPTPTSVVKACSWCGTSCIKKKADSVCAAVMPPANQTCVTLNDGTCSIKGLGLIPVPVTKITCGWWGKNCTNLSSIIGSMPYMNSQDLLFVKQNDCILQNNKCTIVSKPTPTPQPSACSWCGYSCIKRKPGTICSKVYPPDDLICTTLANGTCSIKNRTLIQSASSYGSTSSGAGTSIGQY